MLHHNKYTNPLNVVCGILWRNERFLATQRPVNQSHAGYWEFPGGKVELGETLHIALEREFKEELGITIFSPTFYCKINHNYGATPLLIHFFQITEFEGEPTPLEGQTLSWVTPKEANNLQFLEADKFLLQQLQQM